MELFSVCTARIFCGGILCPDRSNSSTRLGTPAKILTGYVVAGVLLGAAGLYATPIQEWGGAGAAVP